MASAHLIITLKICHLIKSFLAQPTLTILYFVNVMKYLSFIFTGSFFYAYGKSSKLELDTFFKLRLLKKLYFIYFSYSLRIKPFSYLFQGRQISAVSFLKAVTKSLSRNISLKINFHGVSSTRPL